MGQPVNFVNSGVYTVGGTVAASVAYAVEVERTTAGLPPCRTSVQRMRF